jgi:hypothetical protein
MESVIEATDRKMDPGRGAEVGIETGSVGMYPIILGIMVQEPRKTADPARTNSGSFIGERNGPGRSNQ